MKSVKLKNVFISLALILFLYLFVFNVSRVQRKISNLERQIVTLVEMQAHRILTIEEIQILVGAEVDGILGPNTLKKWDKALCDQSAAEYNYMYDLKEEGAK